MKILLINNNPVVSRLTALSARKEDIEIDEIQEVTELVSSQYDIVFVDADSWSKDVEDVISENIDVQKRVLFYAQDDNQEADIFDMSILKPFLPSEVSAVIRSVEESAVVAEENKAVEGVEHFDVFADAKDENREPLFDLEDKLDKIPELEAAEEKRDLMDELTKIDEGMVNDQDSFDQKLEEAFPLKSDELEDELFEKTPEALNLDTELKVESAALPEKNSDDIFELDLNDDKFSLDDELFTEEPKREEAVSNDEILDFDFEKNDELDFANEKVAEVESSVEASKKEVEEEIVTALNNDIEEVKEEVNPEDTTTKVLDHSEIANIKEILQDEKTETMELEDLMAPSMSAISLLETETKSDKVVSEEVEKKKKSKKEKPVSTVNSEVLVETLASLQVETLRELLAGTTVTINIKFPKAK